MGYSIFNTSEQTHYEMLLSVIISSEKCSQQTPTLPRSDVTNLNIRTQGPLYIITKQDIKLTARLIQENL